MEISFERSPGLFRSRWFRVMSKFGFMPSITIPCYPDENGRALLITYRVYYTFWMGGPHRRCFYGLPETIKTADGDCFQHGRNWQSVACDRIEYDTRTHKGRIEFHPSNKSY